MGDLDYLRRFLTGQVTPEEQQQRLEAAKYTFQCPYCRHSFDIRTLPSGPNIIGVACPSCGDDVTEDIAQFYMEQEENEIMALTYRMKGQEYTLPTTVQDIKDADEAGRIRWLATYSKNEPVFEAARALVREYDAKDFTFLEQTIHAPGLLYKNRQSHEGTYVVIPSLDTLLKIRNDFIVHLQGRKGFNDPGAPEEVKHYALLAIQWFFDEHQDASWWDSYATRLDEQFDDEVAYEMRKRYAEDQAK